MKKLNLILFSILTPIMVFGLLFVFEILLKINYVSFLLPIIFIGGILFIIGFGYMSKRKISNIILSVIIFILLMIFSFNIYKEISWHQADKEIQRKIDNGEINIVPVVPIQFNN